MIRLRRFYEKIPDGRTPSRVAYVTSPAALPESLPDAEWTEDAAFIAGDAILANPLLKSGYKEAIRKGWAGGPKTINVTSFLGASARAREGLTFISPWVTGPPAVYFDRKKTLSLELTGQPTSKEIFLRATPFGAPRRVRGIVKRISPTGGDTS